jgi:phosphotransferase system enzyme I (PtsI)
VGVNDITAAVGNGDPLIVDGYRGEVLVCPEEDVIRRYQRRLSRRAAQRAHVYPREHELPAETRDGQRIQLLANIEFPDEIVPALANGAEGIGLYRTEFLYLGRRTLPREEDHYADAVKVLEYCAGREVTFRTCDIGVDKLPGMVASTREINPALGLRSIRLCLDRRDMFKAQLRGLLRAARGNMRLMFPMVSGVDELRQAKAVLEECAPELRAEGHQVPELPVGIMVEMPSAAVTADLLAREAAFFSIGTNDLTQYALAIDRVNEQVNYLFRSFQPAVLRLIRSVVSAADAAGIRLSVCGEMAADPMMTLILLGLGVRSLSMNPLSVPTIKRVIRLSTMGLAFQLADRVMQLTTPGEVETEVGHAMEELFPTGDEDTQS